MGTQSSRGQAENEIAENRGGIGRFLPLPWWRWWGKGESNEGRLIPQKSITPISRWVVEVDNGWHSEPQDVPAFVQRFVMAMEAQEDSDMVPTVEWWELFMDPEDPTLSDSFRELLTGEPPPLSEPPAFQSVRITVRCQKGNQQQPESVAFFRVTGQQTRYFVGHVPGTHAWLWGCCMWAIEGADSAQP